MTVTKQPGEKPLLDFDFSNKMKRSADLIESILSFECTEIVDGAGIVSDLAFSGFALSGKVVQALVSGGVDGTIYKITGKVNASNGQVIEADFYLPVIEE